MALPVSLNQRPSPTRFGLLATAVRDPQRGRKGETGRVARDAGQQGADGVRGGRRGRSQATRPGSSGDVERHHSGQQVRRRASGPEGEFAEGYDGVELAEHVGR